MLQGNSLIFEVISQPPECPSPKRQIPRAGEKLHSPHTAGGGAGCCRRGGSHQPLLRRPNTEPPCYPEMPLPWACPREQKTESPKNLHPNVHNSTVYHSQKVENNPSAHGAMGGWTQSAESRANKYYSAVNTNAELAHAATRMGPENLLSDRSPDTTGHSLYKFLWNVQNGQMHKRQKLV